MIDNKDDANIIWEDVVNTSDFACTSLFWYTRTQKGVNIAFDQDGVQHTVDEVDRKYHDGCIFDERGRKCNIVEWQPYSTDIGDVVYCADAFLVTSHFLDHLSSFDPNINVIDVYMNQKASVKPPKRKAPERIFLPYKGPKIYEIRPTRERDILEKSDIEFLIPGQKYKVVGDDAYEIYIPTAEESEKDEHIPFLSADKVSPHVDDVLPKTIRRDFSRKKKGRGLLVDKKYQDGLHIFGLKDFDGQIFYSTAMVRHIQNGPCRALTFRQVGEFIDPDVL